MKTPITVNGVHIHVEEHGTGKPLVLLHGGIMASEVFGPNIAALAGHRRVIAIHLQGHGHTPDVDRPLRFETLADDVAAVIRELGLGKADLLGYSFGGGVALQTAIRHPEVIDRLIVVSAAAKRDGFYPEVRTAFDHMDTQAAQIGAHVAQSPLGKLYPAVNWETAFRKMGELQSRDYDWMPQVSAIQARTMLVFADADAITLDHMAEFYKALGGGQRDAGLDGSLRAAARLAIVPGTTHYNLLATTTVARLAGEFLEAQ
ncbi:alpha/beta hydrolase [Telluria mixta]|uniref:Alpha/beta hydrolase n=1 Tax=Telluria mixta TaxID=34071 RepID=A0ABT2BYI5_9BURK|nr:alpha/beta hydrolase [Telluria mixta]MCS0629479.1 alpha/beta hydrolase [Telluria mixta]WEM96945.1 alpha/beta hydrolase [Telluria mixta]